MTDPITKQLATTVGNTIEEWLARIGADGLCNSTLHCGCGDGDLFPCDGIQPSCVPAKLRITTEREYGYAIGARVFFPMEGKP